MKNLFLILFLILSSALASAQEMTEIPYVNPAQVVGVYHMGKYPALLLNEGNRGIDKKDIYTLRFMDETIPTQEISVNQGSSLFSVESTADRAVLVFNGRQEISLVTIKPNTEPELKVLETAQNYQFHSLYESGMNMDGSLTLFRNYTKMGKDRKMRDSVIEAGMEFITLSNVGQVLSTRHEPRSKYTNDHVVSIFPTAGGMTYVLESSTPKSKEYELNLVLCDEMGNVRGKRVLNTANTFFPSEVIADNGHYVVSGYYLQGNMYSAKKTEGLFVDVLNSDGGLVATNTYAWDQLTAKLKDKSRSEFIFNGKMNIMVEKIGPTESGYRIICESYSFGTGITPAEFLIGDNNRKAAVVSVYDFVVFETNKSGEVTSVDILPCEPSNIDIGTQLRGKGAMQICNMLKRYQVFPYKGVNGNKIQFVQYKKGEGFYAEMDILSGAITDGKPILLKPEIEEVVDKDYEALKEKSGAIDKLDRFSKRLDKFEKRVDEVGGNAVYGIEKIDRYFNPYERANSGQFILHDNRVITYLINGENYTVYYAFLN